jgi:phosphoserine aminotransferase
MNLLRGNKSADYLDTGIWSKKAIDEASRYCQVNIAGSSKDKNYTYAPNQASLKINKDASLLSFHLK